MNPFDRTPIVLALLAELIHDRTAHTVDDNALADLVNLVNLATGLSLAVDHGAVAALWPVVWDDKSTSGRCARFLLGDTEGQSDLDVESDWSVVVAAAERDAIRTALHDDEARHVAEVERIKSEWAASDQRLVAAHALEVRVLTEQLAAARTSTAEAPTVAVTTHTAWVPTPPGMPMPHHRPLEIPVEGREVLRQTIARLGVRSVALFWGPAPGDLSIVVDLCDGKPTLDEIADALEASHDLKRGTYRLREVKAPPVR